MEAFTPSNFGTPVPVAESGTAGLLMAASPYRRVLFADEWLVAGGGRRVFSQWG